MAELHTPDTPEDPEQLHMEAIVRAPHVLGTVIGDVVAREIEQHLDAIRGPFGKYMAHTKIETVLELSRAVLSLPERDTAEPDTELVERVAEKLRGYQWIVGPNTRELISRGMSRVHLTGGERDAVALAAVQALTDAGLHPLGHIDSREEDR